MGSRNVVMALSLTCQCLKHFVAPTMFGKDSWPQYWSGPWHLASLRRPWDGFRLRDNRAWAFPRRHDERAVGWGGRSCSYDHQSWGQEGIFSWGRLALDSRGFLLSSTAWSMTTCQGSSDPFWLHFCLMLTYHKDTSCALQLWEGRLFHPHGGPANVSGWSCPPLLPGAWCLAFGPFCKQIQDP